MGHRFAELLFSEPVKAVQKAENSRKLYQKWESRTDFNHQLSDRETDFIKQRDSFYLATVSPDGWPYIQHRGGAKGFIKILDDKHIGFADFRGNRQYITTGNIRSNNRAALFFMDYQHQRRLKMLGRLEEVGKNSPDALQLLVDKNYPAKVERGFIVTVEAFDWNCSQHITPRFENESTN